MFNVKKALSALTSRNGRRIQRQEARKVADGMKKIREQRKVPARVWNRPITI